MEEGVFVGHPARLDRRSVVDSEEPGRSAASSERQTRLEHLRDLHRPGDQNDHPAHSRQDVQTGIHSVLHFSRGLYSFYCY